MHLPFDFAMSSSIPPQKPESQAAPPAPGSSLSNDELLPPIEPPSAKFILQLFVVPAVIVAAVVLFWFVIESLARTGEQDVDEIVGALRSSSQARFQKANDLANMLRMPQRYPQLKTNRDLAQKLAVLLDEQEAAADDAESAIRMRMFLASALGEFHVDEGLAALINAALNDPERDVRRKAVNSIAVLAGEMSKLSPPAPLEGDALVEALAALAGDEDELIRSETAFALGVTAATPGADPRLTAALETLIDDPYTDARFNAALGLARLGHRRAAAAVAEMLAADSLASSLASEKPLSNAGDDSSLASQRAFKRNTIVNSALSAIEMLVAKKSLSAEDRQTLETALADFIAAAPEVKEPAPLPKALVEGARRTLADVQAAR